MESVAEDLNDFDFGSCPDKYMSMEAGVKLLSKGQVVQEGHTPEDTHRFTVTQYS